MINKDTKIYGSFSSSPGNNGCKFFNSAFEKRNVNAIYKSFYSNNIQKSVEAVKALDISGFAVSMPFKIDILDLVDEMTKEVKSIGSANTIVNYDGYLKAYNTDYLGVIDYIKISSTNHFYILGNGGFSKAIQYTCRLLNKTYTVITRSSWNLIDTLKDKILFNATPVNVISEDNKIIDGRPFTEEGKQIALEQAKNQFKIYTGIDYE